MRIFLHDNDYKVKYPRKHENESFYVLRWILYALYMLSKYALISLTIYITVVSALGLYGYISGVRFRAFIVLIVSLAVLLCISGALYAIVGHFTTPDDRSSDDPASNDTIREAGDESYL